MYPDVVILFASIVSFISTMLFTLSTPVGVTAIVGFSILVSLIISLVFSLSITLDEIVVIVATDKGF